ncbi:hypothetical protein JSE7799_03830 [Jannaschia seosinensis]|uniref:Uncharacterized protein n=1 Tax=Jannaschia seosinensis TaxID=313367 RepID=A0A0M7BE73_9RHOB|nr:hypothetical protein JSE7799_03830 [Jannaschia seosinensis]
MEREEGVFYIARLMQTRAEDGNHTLTELRGRIRRI